MGPLGSEVTQTDLGHSSQYQSGLSDVLHGGLSCALMMIVPWPVMKVSISGDCFRCSDFVSTRLSHLEIQVLHLLPLKPITNSQQQLKVSSLNASVFTWRSIRTIGGFVPLPNLFSPGAEVTVSHHSKGSTQQIFLFLPNFYMASRENLVLPAVPLNSARILSAGKIPSYLQTSPDSQGIQILIPTGRDVAQL